MVRLLLHKDAIEILSACYHEQNGHIVSGLSGSSSSSDDGRAGIRHLTRLFAQPLGTEHPSQLHQSLPEGVIHHAQLVQIAKHLQGTVELDRLMRGAQLWFPQKKAFVRSAHLEATLAQIRLQQERSTYDSMVSPSSGSHFTPAAGSASVNSSKQEEMEWQEIRSQISALGNIALSGAAVGVATWWSSGQWTPLEVKVLLTATTSIGIIVIEAFLYSRHFERTKMAKEATARGLKGRLTKDAEVVVIPATRKAE